MIEKNKILLISLIISIIFHLIFFLLIFYLLKPQKIKEDLTEKKEIYIYLTRKDIKKESKIIKKKLKIPKSEKKNNKIKKITSKASKKILKNKKNKKVLKRTAKKENKKSNNEKKILKEKKEVKKVIKENELVDNENKKEIIEDNTNTTNIVDNKTENNKKTLSIKDLVGKEEIFELGKKSITEEELNKDEDIQEYIRALTKYLNQLARRKDLYPPMAKRLKLEGSLIIRFTIKKDGSIDEESIKIIISSGYNVLDDGAIRIIKRYVPLFARKYNKYPPKDNFTVELPITFEIINW